MTTATTTTITTRLQAGRYILQATAPSGRLFTFTALHVPTRRRNAAAWALHGGALLTDQATASARARNNELTNVRTLAAAKAAAADWAARIDR